MDGGDEAFGVGEVDGVLGLFVEREEVDDAECVLFPGMSDVNQDIHSLYQPVHKYRPRWPSCAGGGVQGPGAASVGNLYTCDIAAAKFAIRGGIGVILKTVRLKRFRSIH